MSKKILPIFMLLTLIFTSATRAAEKVRKPNQTGEVNLVTSTKYNCELHLGDDVVTLTTNVMNNIEKTFTSKTGQKLLAKLLVVDVDFDGAGPEDTSRNIYTEIKSKSKRIVGLSLVNVNPDTTKVSGNSEIDGKKFSIICSKF